MSEFELDKNQDIQNALREFEAKSSGGMNPPQMPQSGVFTSAADTPKMVRLVMKYSGGAIKDERQAEYVLLGFAVFAILISVFLFVDISGPASDPRSKVFQEDLSPELRQTLPKEVLDTIPYKK